MRRTTRGLVIAATLMAGIVGGVAAVNGIGSLEVFSRGYGTVEHRLSRVEDFLVQHSRDVKTELSRMQEEIDILAAPTWRGLVVADEDRCSPYDSADYSVPASVEAQIVDQLGGVYGPYTGTWFASTSETDIEHIVARSEAHDSGLCAADVAQRQAFARDLLNLTLASPEVNREQKWAYDAVEWLPELNECWFVNRVVEVRRAHSLTIDRGEADAIDAVLAGCSSTEMIVLPETADYAPGSSLGIAIACGTPAEQTYLRAVWTKILALDEAREVMRDPTNALESEVTDEWAEAWLAQEDDLWAAGQAVIDVTPPDTPRAQTFHHVTITLVEALRALTDAMGQAIEDRDASQLLAQRDELVTDSDEAAGAWITALGEFCDAASPAVPTPTARPTGTEAHPLVEEFGCQWIMDTYRPMAPVGRDLAIQFLATSMYLKRAEEGEGLISLIGVGDAAAALRECEAQGYV